MDIAELIRLMGNVIRVGIVTEVDEKNWRVRVASGELDTAWLRWSTQRAGAFSVWAPPSVGEQVWLLCIGGNPETAIIGGSLYSSEHPAPGIGVNELVIVAPDGARFRYDASAGALEVSGIKTASIAAESKITLTTPVVECSELLRASRLEVTEGGKMHGSITHSGGAFTSNGVQIDSHRHGGVQSGGSWTEGTQ